MLNSFLYLYDGNILKSTINKKNFSEKLLVSNVAMFTATTAFFIDVPFLYTEPYLVLFKAIFGSNLS